MSELGNNNVLSISEGTRLKLYYNNNNLYYNNNNNASTQIGKINQLMDELHQDFLKEGWRNVGAGR